MNNAEVLIIYLLSDAKHCVSKFDIGEDSIKLDTTVDEGSCEVTQVSDIIIFQFSTAQSTCVKDILKKTENYIHFSGRKPASQLVSINT